jgi:hypothetical protein
MSAFTAENETTSESLEAMMLKNYDLWERNYSGEDCMDEDADELDLCQVFEEAAGDAFLLEKALRKYLCILDESSDFLELFEEKEFQTITRVILDEVPGTLSSSILAPATDLLVFVTSDGPPTWLNSLLDACRRCAEQCPEQSGFLQAVTHLLEWQFHDQTVSHTEFATSLATATSIVQQGDISRPVTLVSAVKLLSCFIRTSANPVAELSTFTILQQFLEHHLSQLAQSSQSTADLTKVLMISVSEITLAAAALRKSNEGETHLLQSGFLSSVVTFTKDYCIPQDTAMSNKAISSTALLLLPSIVPKNLTESVRGHFEDASEMRKFYETLQTRYGPTCDQMIAMGGHFVIGYAVVREDAMGERENHSLDKLNGLLSLLTFSSTSSKEEMINALKTIPRFFDCLKTHAKAEVWTYSGRFQSKILGIARETVIARLVLTLFFPSYYPTPAELTDNSKNKFGGFQFGSATTVSPSVERSSGDTKETESHPPTAEQILKEILSSHSWILATPSDEWILCLKEFPATKI